MKKIITLCMLCCLLSGCTEKNMNEQIQKAITSAELGSKLHIEKAGILLLYGNEEKDTSYLIAMNIPSKEVSGTLQLDDAYSSIDAYPDSDTQIVINRNENKDKSIVIDVDNYKVLTLQPSEYIETINTSTRGYGEYLQVQKQQVNHPDVFRILQFDSESKVTTENGEFDFVDAFWIEDIIR